MNLLGAWCTVLRLEAGSGVLIHAPLDAPADQGIDLSLNLQGRLTEPVGIAGKPGVMIEPTADPRVVHITRAEQDLWADDRSHMAIFRNRSEGRFAFLLVIEQELADLRTLLNHGWVRGHGADAPQITIFPKFPFMLDLGMAKLDLRQSAPRALPSGAGYALDTELGEITITHAGPARPQVELRKRPDRAPPYPVSSRAELYAGSECWLGAPGAEEYGGLPITVCDADRDWMYKTPYGGMDQIIGRQLCQPRIVHGSNKYVLLSRCAEGVIFDDHSICNEDGYLEGYGYRGGKQIHERPEGMSSDHGRLLVERAALAAAPVIEGPTIVFLMGNLSNYTHWLIDALLVLHVLLDYAPPDAKILLPGTLRTLQTASRRVIDHHDTLRVFGYDQLPAIEIAQPYCRLQDAYWLEGGVIFNMPAEFIRALRARVAALRPPLPRRDGRIHIARRVGRRIANMDMLTPFLERQGFTTHYMEDCSFEEQVEMFSQAEWVISPHGAELGNLLFCRAGTKVLELAPDFDYKPYFSYMCNKLNLTHGVLPCATTDTSFNGDIIINMHKLTALFRMLKSRL